MLVNNKIIRYPVKIGEVARVADYSATILNGEEQLLITREGKFFLTNGKGGYDEFKYDTYSREELDIMFKEYVKTTIYETFKLDIQKSISTLDGAILDVIDDLGDTTKLATHTNRGVLDKFSEDADGKPLYDGNKLATSVEVTDADMDTDINTIWGDTI